MLKDLKSKFTCLDTLSLFYCCRQENPNKYEALGKRTRSTLVAPKHSPASPGYSPASPGYSPASPGYSSASPGYIPPLTAQFLPTPDFNLLPSSTTASTTSESAQYPLKKEPSALLELVNSVRVDLLQTAMLVNYISDYIKNWK